MDGSNDIYHKEDVPLPVRRRRGQRVDRPETPLQTASGTTSGLPSGTHQLGAPVTPIQIARQHLQMQPQQHLRRRRRRRGSHQSEQKLNRWIWGLIIAVVVAYLAVLVASVARNRLDWFKKKPQTVQAPAPAAVVVPPVMVNATGRLVDIDSGLPVIERVQNWSRGQKVIEEVETLIRNGRGAAAREKLDQAGAWIPGSVDRLYGLARLALTERNYPEAERLLLRVVEAEPAHADARNDLADALQRNGRYADAMAVAEWICQNDTYSETGHRIAAESALELGDASKAIEHLRKLTNLRSDDLSIKNNLGIAYLRAGSHSEAARIFNEILTSDERNPTAHYNLALVLARQGKADEAVRLLSVAGSRLGRNFVGSWMSSADFDVLRTNSAFITLQKEYAAAPGATNAPTASAGSNGTS